MNQLSAVVEAVVSSEHLTCLKVVCSGATLHLFLAEVCDPERYIDHEVILAFKESEVILFKNAVDSTANMLVGRIEKIEKGAVLTQVTIATLDQTVAALVSTAAVGSMMLAEGDSIFWMINPSEISLLRGDHGI